MPNTPHTATSDTRSQPVRRIFIECTHTYYNGKYTGIQRVVRALAQHAEASGKQVNIKCYPVVWSFWGFLQIDQLPRDGKAAFRWTKNVCRSAYRTFFPDRPPPSSPATPNPTTGKPAMTLLPRPGQKIIWFRRFSYLLASIFCHWPSAIFTRRVQFGPGDLLLLADASWNQPLWSDLTKIQARGCKVGVLVYDVIAATNPDWFDPPLAASFQDWLARAVSQCQFYVGISDATRQSIAQILPDLATIHPDLPTNPQLQGGSFKLGVDIRFSAPKQDSLQPKELDPLFLPERKRCLAVGTIEPRKNHTFLIDGFNLAAQQDPSLDLIIVGRPGWRCQELVKQITQHPLFGKRIFWLSNLDDQGLELAYQQSHVLACLSLAEGFGLPIIEGLVRKLPVVCSDLPVFREVGGSFVQYVPLGDTSALAASLITTTRRPPSLPNFSWPNWQESTVDLLQVLIKLNT